MFFYMRRKYWKKNVDNQLAFWEKKGGQPTNSLAYMCVCMSIGCCVQFRGFFWIWLFGSSRPQILATKTTLSPGVRLFLRQKLTPKITTCRRTSNAFKNGALMLRNISTPFSNVYTRPIFERYFFVLFAPYQGNPYIRETPIFVGFLTIRGLRVEPPQTEQKYIPRHKEITKNEKRKYVIFKIMVDHLSLAHVCL